MKVLQQLPPELTSHIAQLLLADDVVDYISFRAVCRKWRSCTASPRSLDSCFRPRRWIMLPDCDANLYTASHRRFLNLSTGRSLLLHLPELDSHYVLSDSDGLLVLVEKVTSFFCLFNPFTRHLVDLALLPTDMESVDGCTHLSLRFRIAHLINRFIASISSDSCPTVLFFSPQFGSAYFVKLGGGGSSWVYIDFQRTPNSMLFFKNRVYMVNRVEGIQCVDLDQKSFTTLIPLMPDRVFDQYYLVEYNSDLLLVYQKTSLDGDGRFLQFTNYTHNVFRVDLESKRLVSLGNARDLSVFLGCRTRCLVLSSKCLPSIKGNSIYFCTDTLRDPIIVYDFDDGESESISVDTVLYDCDHHRLRSSIRRVKSSIRPFTLAHHLATYCKPLNWSVGLMYHEFLYFPPKWLSECDTVDDFIRNYSMF